MTNGYKMPVLAWALRPARSRVGTLSHRPEERGGSENWFGEQYSRLREGQGEGDSGARRPPPSTGATKIAASQKLTFTPAKAIKDALNG